MLWSLVNDQRDAQFFTMYLFLFLTLYMFRAHRAHHQQRQIVSIQPLCRWPCHVQVEDTNPGNCHTVSVSLPTRTGHGH